MAEYNTKQFLNGKVQKEKEKMPQYKTKKKREEKTLLFTTKRKEKMAQYKVGKNEEEEKKMFKYKKKEWLSTNNFFLIKKRFSSTTKKKRKNGSIQNGEEEKRARAGRYLGHEQAIQNIVLVQRK